jgi:aspartate-semialdehyde dehydrogenase
VETRDHNLTIAVVGITGIVGQEFVKILEQRRFPVGQLKAFASKASQGGQVSLMGKDYPVEVLHSGCFVGCDLAFFSAGASVSSEWAPQAVREGCFVVDNSSAFRMDEDVPLVVPEVNFHEVKKRSTAPHIIANPNCSTIQMVLVLKALADRFGLQGVTVATYQSVSGAGREGIEELKEQTRAVLDGELPKKGSVFPHPMAFTNLPHIDEDFRIKGASCIRDGCAHTHPK